MQPGNTASDLEIARDLDRSMSLRDYDSIWRLHLSLPGGALERHILTLVQIAGIHVPGEPTVEPLYNVGSDRQGNTRYRELSLRCRGKVLRLRSRDAGDTPFSLRDGQIHIDRQALSIEAATLSPEWNDRNSGFYFPQRDGRLAFESIRFNPRNLGGCAGGCVFCQRSYSLPTPHEASQRRDWAAHELVRAVEDRYPRDVFAQVRHALVVTELYGSPERYLTFCEDLKGLLVARGFRGQFSALAQEVRSREQIERLYRIVNAFDFCYTLECFDRRRAIMSSYKALPIDQVCGILRTAHDVGFQVVMINYVAGLDSIPSFARGMERIGAIGGVHAVGLNVLTPYTDGQERLAHPDALTLSYYVRVIRIIQDNGAIVYRPDLYERCPALAEVAV